MTSRDVRDILSLAAAPAAGPSTSKKAPGAPRQARPQGVSRELHALLGANAPALALAPQLKPAAFAARRPGQADEADKGPVHWQMVDFSNGARDDGRRLRLRHWQRDVQASYDPATAPYKFECYNTTSGVFAYTDDEYTAHLKDESWSRPETDQLFALANAYDLRFVVMADRWPQSTTAPQRSMEDLKARYYSVCRRLVRARPPPGGDEGQRSAQLQGLNFDKGREAERKGYLRSLLNRTDDEIREEDFLYIESRRLEQNYARISREREDLLRILGGREGIGHPAAGQVTVGGGGADKGRLGQSGGPSGAAGPSGTSGDNRKARKSTTGWEFEGLNGGGLPEGWQGQGSARLPPPAQDAANCVDRHPAPSVSAPKAHQYPSVSLRSTRLTAVKSSIQPRVAAALQELGLGVTLVLPTKGNMGKLDALQAELGRMVELKKALDRADGEVRVLRRRREVLLEREGSGSVVPQERQGSVGSVKQEEAAKKQGSGKGKGSSSARGAAGQAEANEEDEDADGDADGDEEMVDGEAQQQEANPVAARTRASTSAVPEEEQSRVIKRSASEDPGLSAGPESRDGTPAAAAPAATGGRKKARRE